MRRPNNCARRCLKGETAPNGENGALLEHLQAEGISPTAIDTIIITHGDIDHIGGIATPENQLVFQNASYILLKEARDFWSNAAVVARWPEFLTVFGRKTLPLIQQWVKVTQAGVEFWPGFQLILAPGHRLGHNVLSITSSGEHFLII